MGVFWFSSAEIVTTEPQELKALIEQITTETFSDDLDAQVTPVHDLRIEKNSLFFHSAGCGCYGVEWENPCSLLFEKLFERFEGALLCFESVSPCQSQGYYFSSIWAKPEGEVDWDDSETCHKYCHVLLEDGDPSEQADEGEFDHADIWCIDLERLERNKEQLPCLYTAFLKAKQDNFEDWAHVPYPNDDTETQVISYEVACKLAELYDDDELAVLDDCHKDMTEAIKITDWLDILDLEFEFPEDFPTFQIKPNF
ncbi:hypothetical protein LEP3755_57170 [Leptolyngbya sp. NIES-3755]|nr:hypothetical protein LEP3755_57170 [Leptolyngbya sp. NIES-3755]